MRVFLYWQVDAAFDDGIKCFFPAAAAEKSWNYFDPDTDAPISEDLIDNEGKILQPQVPGVFQPIKIARRVSVYDDYTLEGLKKLITAAFKPILANRAEGGLLGWT